MGALVGIGGAAYNMWSGHETNVTNRDIADRQMAFQMRASNSSHTREVMDLQRAGLNPILSANSGASSPSGASATMVNPAIDLPSILQVRALDQGQQRLDIDKANSAAGIAKSLTDQEVNKANVLMMKGGIMSKYLGTDAAPLKEAVKNKLMQFMQPQTQFNRMTNKQPTSSAAIQTTP